MYKNIFAKLRWQVPAQLSRRHARHLGSGCNTHLGWWTACCVSAPAAPSPPPCSGTGWAASPCRRGSARDLGTDWWISCYNQTYIPYSCHNQTEQWFRPIFALVQLFKWIVEWKWKLENLLTWFHFNFSTFGEIIGKFISINVSSNC